MSLTYGFPQSNIQLVKGLAHAVGEEVQVYCSLQINVYLSGVDGGKSAQVVGLAQVDAIVVHCNGNGYSHGYGRGNANGYTFKKPALLTIFFILDPFSRLLTLKGKQ